MAERIVHEVDVLIGSIRWLAQRGVTPRCISIAVGSEAGKDADRRHLEAELADLVGFLGGCSFPSKGPDYIGSSDTEFWQLECKGAGIGVSQTQRNNFDRALASVVSYYRDSATEFDATLSGQPVLGLALPATAYYLRELRRRVQRPLRSRLNLWILLYSPATREVHAVGPGDDYPEPGLGSFVA